MSAHPLVDELFHAMMGQRVYLRVCPGVQASGIVFTVTGTTPDDVLIGLQDACMTEEASGTGYGIDMIVVPWRTAGPNGFVIMRPEAQPAFET